MSDRATILEWTERGAIQDAAGALDAAGVPPTARDWRAFLDRLLLWSGASALGAAVIFFVAHNWGALGAYAKFGLLEMAIVAAVAGYWLLGPDKAAGKASLLVSCLVLGALLALVGQTYQTGADTFELFGAWALLIAPWVIVGRFAALWILWIALANLAVSLYFRTFGGWLGFVFADEDQLWVLFVLNTAALMTWELAARGIAWLTPRWAPRVLAVASGTAITVLALSAVFERNAASILAIAVYAAWLGCCGYVYVRVKRDLFVVAGGCLSLIVVITAFLARDILGRGGAGGLLLIALIVIGMAAAAGWWLKRLAAEARQ